jgi:hypothetical protein
VNQNLGTLVSSIVTHFDQIIEVIINKDSHYRPMAGETYQTLHTNKQDIKRLLRNIDKLQSLNCTNVVWTSFAELRIWL